MSPNAVVRSSSVGSCGCGCGWEWKRNIEVRVMKFQSGLIEIGNAPVNSRSELQRSPRSRPGSIRKLLDCKPIDQTSLTGSVSDWLIAFNVARRNSSGVGAVADAGGAGGSAARAGADPRIATSAAITSQMAGRIDASPRPVRPQYPGGAATAT